MFKQGKYAFEKNLIFHAFVGLICALLPKLVIPWVLYVIFFEGVIKVTRSQNAHFLTAKVACYLAAMEMMVRMSRSGLPHELVKYAIILVLIVGLLSAPSSRKHARIFILIFLLQIPSILVVNAADLEELRQMLSFNLSGPLCLAISGFYFYRLPLSNLQLVQLLRLILLPIAATLTFLTVRTPKVSDISFSFGANFDASGYGPNQMASLLGFGILVLGLIFLLKLPVFRSTALAVVFFSFTIYRGLLTFSRGGVLGPLLVLVILFLYFGVFNHDFRKKRVGRLILILGIVFTGLYGVFSYVDQLTNGALYNRYAGVNRGEFVNSRAYTSGRLDIMTIDLAIYNDYPILGAGPGMGNGLRMQYGYGQRVNAHVEYSRLLAEHGVLGVFVILLICGIPAVEFLRRKYNNQRVFLAGCVLFCLFFMTHSATRLALPMLMYGLGFILLIPDRKNPPSSNFVSRG